MRVLEKMYLTIVIAMVILNTGYLESRTVVISMGDNLFIIGAPYDSESTIRENFEAMKRDHHVNRVWWRGGQDKYAHQYFDLVEESLLHYYIWEWAYLHDSEASMAVDICKDLGVEVWMWTGLFEFGASKDTGGSSFFPYVFESKLRKEHPEWLPVNKYGTRQQAGPIEFCYPEARAAYIQTLKDFLLQEGYEGIVFYTYAENFGTRYLDEFGFNQPIVDEFRNRYGVDIRTEPFDKEAWAALRGEYVTQFLRELGVELQPHGIKVAIMLSSETPELPSLWPGGWSSADKQRIGRILMDWHTWVNEGLVDELSVDYPGSITKAQELLNYCQQYNPNVQVSMCLESGYLPEGVIQIVFSGTAAQSGFPVEQVLDPPNNFEDPAQILRDGDKWQKRQVLYLASLNRITLDVNDIATASIDDDVFVRSMAIRALRASGLTGAIPFIEARLNDTENSVRCLAAVELGNLPGPDSLKKILDTIVSYGNCQYNFSAVPQSIQQMKSGGNLGSAQKLLLSSYFSHADPNVRETVIYSVGSSSLASEFKSEILNMASYDTDYFSKTQAMSQFAGIFGIAETYDILKTNIEGVDQIIQVRAAESLGYYETRLFSYKNRSLQLLLDLFKKYGYGSDRLDQEWGWRSVGNAILSVGSEGETELEKLMCETTDAKLANLAWKTLYIRQHNQKNMPITEEQDKIAHKLNPSIFNVPCKVDLIRDGEINMMDFVVLANSWLSCNLSPQSDCY